MTGVSPVAAQTEDMQTEDMQSSGYRSGGAIVVTIGGEPRGKGNFYPAAFIANAKDCIRIVDEEQFGPALPVIRYSCVDDAVEKASSLKFGLAASVWSSDGQAARAVAERLEAGPVYINKHAGIAPHVPFGGVKCSGIGAAFSEEGLEAYTNIKIYNAVAERQRCCQVRTIAPEITGRKIHDQAVRIICRSRAKRKRSKFWRLGAGCCGPSCHFNFLSFFALSLACGA